MNKIETRNQLLECICKLEIAKTNLPFFPETTFEKICEAELLLNRLKTRMRPSIYSYNKDGKINVEKW